MAARKTPEQLQAERERGEAIIAANLQAPAMARNDGITIRGKSPWQPSVTATARIKSPLPIPGTCPCCGSQRITCMHHDEMQGHSNSIWPWSFLCLTCRATAALVPFTNIPAAQLETIEMRVARLA